MLPGLGRRIRHPGGHHPIRTCVFLAEPKISCMTLTEAALKLPSLSKPSVRGTLFPISHGDRGSP